ncbi:MAG TPA: BBP7 family outer membrane beta-barrel protein [Pirellulaceae bacterium]|jgi:hypothetical protein
MSAAQRLTALIRTAVTTGLFAAMCNILTAQQPQDGQPRAPRVADMLPQPTPDTTGDAWVDPQGQTDDNTPKRYDEPPPPPFDYWQPTWMPCQSLRVNRSLVLGHAYFGMDMMGWATKGVHVPALVTTGTAASGGFLGFNGTSVLFGDETLHKDMRPGGQLRIGWWFDPNQYSGIEWHYFELDGQNIHFNTTSQANNGILALPYFDTSVNGERGYPLGFPGFFTGSGNITSNMQLTSTGILYRKLFWASPTSRIDYLAGYRHVHLYDNLRIGDTVTDVNSGLVTTRVDTFRAINQFDGADLGIKSWWSPTGTLALTGTAKAAIGASNNTVLINGTHKFTALPTAPGGVFALPSNSGMHSQQQFGFVYEVNGGIEWTFACQWKFNLGYTWFYWNQVARAPAQLNRNIDEPQIFGNGGGNPTFTMHTTSFWAQGINGGFTYQF